MSKYPYNPSRPEKERLKAELLAQARPRCNVCGLHARTCQTIIGDFE